MTLKTVLRLSKNMSALLIGRVGTMLLSFVFVVYLARLMGVEGFGKYAIAQRYFDLFLGLSATGLSILITREIAKQPDLLHRYLSASVVMVTGLAVLAGSILVAIAWLSGYAADTQLAIYLVALALAPAAIGQIFESVFVAFEKAEFVTYSIATESLLRTGLSLLVLLLGYGLIGLYVVLMVSRVIMLLFYFVLINRKISKLRWLFAWDFLKQMVRDWRVFALENWMQNVQASLGTITLSIVAGEGAVGVYDAAVRVLRLGSIIASSYTNAMYPYLSRLFVESQDAFKQLSQGTLKYMLAFILPFTVTLSIFADRIIVLLYTEAYAASTAPLRILAWTLLLGFVNPFLSYVLFARTDQHKSLQVALFKLLYTVVACLLFIPRWGAVGVAWVGLTSALLSFGMYFVFVMRGNDLAQALLSIGRPVLAALTLGAFLLLLKDIELIPLLAAGAALYVLLIFVLRVLSTEDLKLLMRHE